MTFLSLFNGDKTHPKALPTFDFDKGRTTISYNFGVPLIKRPSYCLLH